MFEQSARWNEYYRELKPAKRRAMLDELCASEPDDGANEYRRRLFEARHVDLKAPGRPVDRMLFMCVCFMQLCQSSRLFRGGAIREVRRSMNELRFDLAPSREENREDRVARDIWQMTDGLSRRTGLERELALWNQAVRDAYCLTGEGAKRRLDACSERMSK